MTLMRPSAHAMAMIEIDLNPSKSMRNCMLKISYLAESKCATKDQVGLEGNLFLFFKSNIFDLCSMCIMLMR
jgi:hypothetical protein